MYKRKFYKRLVLIISIVITFSSHKAFGVDSDLMLGSGKLKDFFPVDLEIVKEAKNLGGKVSDIWPTFNFSQFPILLHGENSELLIDHPNPPKEFTLLKLPGWGKRIYFTDKPIFHLPMATALTIANIDTCVVPAYKFYPLYSQKASEQLKIKVDDAIIDFMIPVFIHEAFHGWQSEKNHKKMCTPSFNSYPEFSPWNNAMKNLEGKLLWDAYVHTKKIKNYIEKFLEVRAERRSKLTPQYIELENRAECVEGLATYVQYQISKMAKENYKPLIKKMSGFSEYQKNELIEWCLNPLLYVAEEDRGNLSLPAYQLGLGEGLALDKLYPQWKEEIWKDGVWLDELLAKSIGKKLDYNAASYKTDDVKRQYNFQDMLKKEEIFCSKFWAERKQIYEAFLGKTGTRITLVFNGLKSEVGHMYIITDSIKLEGSLVYIKSGIKFMLRNEEFKVQIKNVPVIYDPATKLCTVVLNSDFLQQVKIFNNDKIYIPKGQNFTLDGKIEVIYPDFEITSKSLKWMQEGHEVTIQF